MRRRLLPVLLVAGTLALGAAGCSGSSEGATSTTAASTTTTQPEITDAEIIANINEKLRPVLAEEYDAEAADCIIGVLEEAGVGDLSADEVPDAFQDRCKVTPTEVTGVITASVLVERGATEEAATCVGDKVAQLTYEQIENLGEEATNQLYEDCGVDVAALTTD